MSGIGRRELLRSSAAFAATPIGALLSFRTPRLSAQSTVLGAASAQKYAPLCQSVFDDVNDGLAQAVVKLRQRVAQPADMVSAAQKMKLLGHHYQETGIDDQVRMVGAKLDAANIDLTNQPYRDQALSFLQQYDPSMTALDMPVPEATPAEMSVVLNHVRNDRLSAICFDFADRLKDSVNNLTPPDQYLVRPSYSSHFEQVSYNPDSLGGAAFVGRDKARIRPASCFFGVSRSTLCHMLSWTDRYWATVALVFALTCDVEIIASPACALLASSGYILSKYIIEDLEFELCNL